jgi:hypothetical protein
VFDRLEAHAVTVAAVELERQRGGERGWEI